MTPQPDKTMSKAKQLEEAARQHMQGGDMYCFTPEHLQAYKSQLCREQRERSAQKANDLITEMFADNGRLITPSLVRKEIEEGPL